jgi:hypothetical protein
MNTAVNTKLPSLKRTREEDAANEKSISSKKAKHMPSRVYAVVFKSLDEYLNYKNESPVLFSTRECADQYIHKQCLENIQIYLEDNDDDDEDWPNYTTEREDGTRTLDMDKVEPRFDEMVEKAQGDNDKGLRFWWRVDELIIDEKCCVNKSIF